MQARYPPEVDVPADVSAQFCSEVVAIWRERSLTSQLSYWGSCGAAAAIALSGLLRWRVVEWLAFINDMDGQELDRLVANDPVATVRHIPNVQTNGARRLLSIRRLDRTAF